MRGIGQTTLKIRTLLLRDFLAAGVFVLVACIGLIIWAGSHSYQREQFSHYSRITEMIGELVRPSVSISEYGETERLLGLVAEQQKVIPAVVTREGDWILADYEARSLLERVSGLRRLPSGCGSLPRTIVAAENGASFDVFCSAMHDPKAIGSTPKAVGAVIVLHRHDSFSISPWFAGIWLGIIFSTIVLMIYVLNRRIRSTIVEPLERLAHRIEDRAKTPLVEGDLSQEQVTVRELANVSFAFSSLLGGFKEERQRSQELEKKAALAAVAKKVSHNIKSPLEGMEAHLQAMPEISEEHRISLRNGLARIRDITNELSAQAREIAMELDPDAPKPRTFIESPSLQLISGLVDSLMSEKRIEYRTRFGIDILSPIDNGGYGLFATIQPSEFKSVLSNLVNNAVEAIENKGVVKVTAGRHADDHVFIEIQDTGRGIPENVLPRLGENGFSIGKPNGNGFGLYHAKRSVESWGGKIEIRSAMGKGTTVLILLPASKAPAWFVPSLAINPDVKVIVLDDDTMIHQVWDSRLLQAGLSPERIRHFGSGAEFLSWGKANVPDVESALFLVDYELIGEDKNGLDLIEVLNVGERSILVTSHADDAAVIERAQWLGARVIPKSLARLAPIQIQ